MKGPMVRCRTSNASNFIAWVSLIAAMGFGLLWGPQALAQAWPSKPVKIIVPYPPGSTMDGFSRVIAQKLSELVKTQLEKLGFKTKLRLVTQDTMYTEFCNKPKAKVTVCPNVGWLKDFSDPQTILDPTFNGKNIVPENNSNWPLLDVSSINSAMDKAETIVDSDQRNNAWAEIDKQVTAQAPAIPWIWDDNPNIRSANVQGVVNKFNGNWDLSFTSIK